MHHGINRNKTGCLSVSVALIDIIEFQSAAFHYNKMVIGKLLLRRVRKILDILLIENITEIRFYPVIRNARNKRVIIILLGILIDHRCTLKSLHLTRTLIVLSPGILIILTFLFRIFQIALLFIASGPLLFFISSIH